MTYTEFESSIEDGEPEELYEFAIGAATFRYTSGESTRLVGANEFFPRAIKRGKVESGPERRGANFVVTLPTSDQLSQLFLGVLPSQRMSVVVMRYHDGDTGGGGPEVITIFTGFVLTASFSKSGKECKLNARHGLANLGTLMPANSFMAGCNWVLYDEGTCDVDDTSPLNRIATDAVVSVAASNMVVSSIVSGGFADGSFNAGYVESIATGELRLILDQVGDTLTLMSPFRAAPTVVNILRGCGHTIEACGDDHDNVGRFGGFAFVPLQDPHRRGAR